MHFLFAWLSVSLAAAACLIAPGEALDGAGVRLTVTNKLLAHLTAVAKPGVEKTLRNLDLEGVTLSYDENTITVTVSSIVCEHGAVGGMDLRISDHNTVAVNISNLFLSCNANWEYQEDLWPHLPRGRGRMHLEFSTDVAGDMVLSAVQRRPHVALAAWHSDARISKLSFDGGLTSLVLELFHDLTHRRVRARLNRRLRELIETRLVSGFNNAMDAINPMLPLPLPAPFDIAQADFSVLAIAGAPQHISASLHGEVYNKATPAEAPFVPPALPPPAPSVADHMLELALHPFLFETAAWTFERAGLLQHTVTQESLPAGIPFQLTTSTFEGWAPDMARQYPDAPVQLSLHVSGPTSVAITPAGANVSAPIDITFLVLPKNRTVPVEAFALKCPGVGGVDATAREAVLFPVVSFLACPISLSWSRMGEVDAAMAAQFVSAILSAIAVPKINARLAAGFPLPSVPGVSFVNSELTMSTGFVRFRSDLQAKPADAPAVPPLLASAPAAATVLREQPAPPLRLLPVALEQATRLQPNLNQLLLELKQQLTAGEWRQLMLQLGHAQTAQDVLALLPIDRTAGVLPLALGLRGAAMAAERP